MELLSVTTVSIALFVCLLAYFIRFGFIRRDPFTPNGVPIHKPIRPFVGSMWGIWKTDLHQRDIDLRKKYGKVWGEYRGTEPLLCIADCDLMRDVLIKDFDAFPNRPNPFRSDAPIQRKFITVLEGEEWKFVRSNLTPVFTTGKLKKIVGLIDECAQDFAKLCQKDADENGGHVNVRRNLQTHQLNVIATSAFGTKLENIEDPNNEFVTNARKIATETINSPWILLPFIFPKAMQYVSNLFLKKFQEVIDFFANLLKRILENRKSRDVTSERGDMLDLMMEEVKNSEGKLTEEHVIANCVIFFLAGNETLVTSFSWLVYFLVIYPDIQDKVYQEIRRALDKNEGKLDSSVLAECTYLDQVINETLRYQSPAVRLERVAARDYNLHGIPIAKGDTVSISVSSVHHDSDYYSEPEKFDPDRFSRENRQNRHPLAFLAFGAGGRNCIGQRLAIEVMAVTLIRLLDNFRLVKGSYNTYPIKATLGFSQAPSDFHFGIEKRKKSEEEIREE